jgi:hypothetical protein
MTGIDGKRLVIDPCPTLRELSETNTEDLADACLCFVHERRTLYVYLREGHSLRDSPDVVKPISGTGQWERTTCRLVG